MFCHNTYAFSLLFYKVHMKRENAGSWNSGLEKEQTLETYSAQLQKPRNSIEYFFGKYKKYLAEEIHERGHWLASRVGGVPPPRAPPCLEGQPVGPRCPSSPIWSVLTWKKSGGGFRDQTPPSRGGTEAETNIGLQQSCSAGDTSLREGEIITAVITNNSPILGRVIFIKP